MTIKKEILNWLMEGDPAIRFQVLRDLVGDTEAAAREKERITAEGWGARLLSLQDPVGTWANGIYGPKWTSTHYTMMLLRRFEAEPVPAIQKACKILLDKGFYPKDNGINFFPSWKQSEHCVTGMVLSILATFRYVDPRLHLPAGYLFKCQMPDGGWNCNDHLGHTHSSFHTTISALEGLRAYEKHILPRDPNKANQEAVIETRDRALEFLLQHRLYCSHRTGEPVDIRMTRFSFPPRWYYDIMRALDFAQDVDAPRDERFSDAVAILKKKETPEGKWKVQNHHTGRIYFHMEKTGSPSRWNTLRALRILKWWERSQM